MTNKQKKDLQFAVLMEQMNCDCDIDQLKMAYRNLGMQLDVIQEEMKLSKHEALFFLGTMMGQMMHQ